MTELLSAFLDHAFLRNAFLVGFLASIACGIIGTYVVIKRISFISGGIAHTVLAGLGFAYFIGANPLYGAIVAAVAAAVIIGLVSMHAQAHEDTIIAALWAVGMAIGIIFISRTPGYNEDLMSYLFGNLLLVNHQDVILIIILNLVILFLVAFFYKRFLAVCFDEEYARLQGVPVSLIYLLLLILIALTVVILIQVVGLILVIALISLPAAIAGLFADSVRRMMVLAVFLGILFTTAGLAVSYNPDLPAGATIIILAGCTYLLALPARQRIRSRKKKTGTQDPGNGDPVR